MSLPKKKPLRLYIDGGYIDYSYEYVLHNAEKWKQEFFEKNRCRPNDRYYIKYCNEIDEYLNQYKEN